jgi:hypothetical protein
MSCSKVTGTQVTNVSSQPSGDEISKGVTPAAGLESSIQEAAEGPKQVTGDQGSYTAHSIRDLIAADRYLASKKSVKSKKKTLGGLFSRMSPPSARG